MATKRKPPRKKKPAPRRKKSSVIPVSASMITTTPSLRPGNSGFGGVAGSILRMLPRAQTLVPHFAELAAECGFDVDIQRTRLFTFDDKAKLKDVLPPKLPAGRFHQDWAAQSLILALLARAGGVRVADVDVDGDFYVPGGDLQIAGDVHVKGNLAVEGALVVVGDLKVGGRFTDAVGAHTVVTGVMMAGHSLVTEGFLSVGGGTLSPFVLLDFNQGFAKLLGGVEARVFVESDHGGSRVHGAVDVDCAAWDECVFDAEPPALDVSRLRALLRTDLEIPDEPDARDLSSTLGPAAKAGALFRDH